jgi:hypothetical protein
MGEWQGYENKETREATNPMEVNTEVTAWLASIIDTAFGCSWGKLEARGLVPGALEEAQHVAMWECSGA